MSMKKRILAAGAALCLALTLLTPMPALAAEVTFTAINERVLPLDDDTMPIWSGNNLYVPYTTFDADSNGMRWNIRCSYDRSGGVITVFDLDKLMFLEFDLREGTCQDSVTGETFSPGAILRGSQPYLPVKVVCSYFGLRYTYREIDQGNLLRIKTDEVVLSDSKFIDAATNALSLRLREYDQQEEETQQSGQPGPTPQPDQPDEQSVPTYLSLRCDSDEYLAAILSTLDSRRVKAMFFVTPELADRRGDLILWMLGAGHSVGLLAPGQELDRVRATLNEGEEALAQQVFLRPSVACVDAPHRDTLAKEGWICWNTTLELTPGEGDGSTNFARRTIQRLKGRNRAVYLTLDDGADALRVLPTLLTRLEEEGYELTVPLETRL